MKRHMVAILTCALFSLPACSQQHLEVGDWCIPQEFVSPANSVSNDLNDENFDEAPGDLAILYFEADYVSDRVDGYNAQVEVAEGLMLTQALHVNLHGHKRDLSSSNNVEYRPFLDSTELVTADPKNSSEWNLYHQPTTGAMSFWGVCHDNFQGGFTCMRTLQDERASLTYNLEKPNLKVYKEVDEFLARHLTSWMCSSR